MSMSSDEHEFSSNNDKGKPMASPFLWITTYAGECWCYQLALNGGRSSSSAAGSSTRKRGRGSGMRADRLGGSSVKSPVEPGPELSGREGGVIFKVLNLGSLRSSSVSISGNGPPKLGAGWGSVVSTRMETRLSARGEKGAAGVVAGAVASGGERSGEFMPA